MIKSLIYFIIILVIGQMILFYLKYFERKKRRELIKDRIPLSIQDNYKILNIKDKDIDFENFIFALKKVAKLLHIEINDINIADKLSVYDIDIPFLIDSDIDALISEIYECEFLKNTSSIREVSIRDIVICIIELEKRDKA